VSSYECPPPADFHLCGLSPSWQHLILSCLWVRVLCLGRGELPKGTIWVPPRCSSQGAGPLAGFDPRSSGMGSFTHPDHGFPCTCDPWLDRGGRMVKSGSLTSRLPLRSNWYHYHDNKVCIGHLKRTCPETPSTNSRSGAFNGVIVYRHLTDSLPAFRLYQHPPCLNYRRYDP
jgi:hypothetical protein